ncbi:MAG: hypothetical protein IKN02_04395 [Prevotella sp.]|jgi:hypothetical protein|nr:hypothetical protein [Prevotella sp.]
MMKTKILCLLGILISWTTLTAFAACGDNDDEVTAGAPGEACIVAMLPTTLAPYLSLEVTYYDAQGNAKSFTVKDGETSDDLLSYSKQALQQLSLFSAVTINDGKCIVRTVKFALPANKKIVCKYRLVRTDKEPTAVPTDNKVFAPFAVPTGKRPNGDALPIGGTLVVNSTTLSTLESFQKLLELYNGREHESYIIMD